jgi:ABC-type antimicrobial peptide transport system permease subunit
MSITERFREIATMKCLGATDGYILTQFLMEAGIQGAFGGAIGTVLGLLLSLTKGTWLYGGHLFNYFPVVAIIISTLACIAAGLILATIASIYPSWMASRMAPMEAMRVE